MLQAQYSGVKEDVLQSLQAQMKLISRMQAGQMRENAGMQAEQIRSLLQHIHEQGPESETYFTTA